MEEPKIMMGGTAIDDRGSVCFINEFDFADVKRFYQVRNYSTGIVRAFHGHSREAKYIYVATGSAIIIAVPLADLLEVKQKPTIHRFVLSAAKPAILFIPENYANGFRCLEENTILQFFSTATIEESSKDDTRFPFDILGKEVWEIINR
jgi:dTDP-4-dehydrorhamnose 3,5-epimerase-like enzyme